MNATPPLPPSTATATSWQPIVLLVLAATGGYFGLLSPLDTARPKAKGNNPLINSTRPESVLSRLWQDPLSAVSTAIASSDDEAEGPEARLVSRSLLHNDVAQRKHNLLVLPVLVKGGPYPEESERRRRTRYAIVTALHSVGYVPLSNNRIGYFEFEPPSEAGVYSRSPVPIPFEWFENPLVPSGTDGSSGTVDESASPSAIPRWVVVLWVSDDVIARSPFSRIAHLLNLLGEHCRVAMIGPAHSSSLKAWRDDSREHKHQLPYSTRGLPVKMYSPFSTIDRDFEAHPNAPKIEKFSNYLLQKSPDSGILKQLNSKLLKSLATPFEIVRTVHKDAKLAGTIFDELENRDFKIGKSAVVLVTEMDTTYGREIATTFVDEFEQRLEKTPQASDKLAQHIRTFSYLRGVDGSLPPEQSTVERPLRAPITEQGSNNPMMAGLANEDAVGPEQLDYIRRLADRLEHFVRKHNVRAIGVLGSDVYDNLLVLQALRQRFKGCYYFTTDLDARMIHPKRLQWTRNLLIASSFGFGLSRDLQKDTAAFRGNYQTATYYAALCALEEATPRALLDCYPRIFEIGRTRVHDLTPLSRGDQQSIHVRRKDGWHTYPTRPWWLVIWAAIFAGLTISATGTLSKTLSQFRFSRDITRSK